MGVLFGRVFKGTDYLEASLLRIVVNNGLLRREEADRTLAVFENNLGMNIVYIDATDRFLHRLKDVVDPEEKRKIIGEEFIRVFEEEADRIGKVDFLAQGTLYPDVIESVSSVSTASAIIKSHHNVGGLPAKMVLNLLEPLRFLFKDEVRLVGKELGLPEEMIRRQPFPGPGLAIRCIGEVTREKLEILRSADFILMNEIKKAMPAAPLTVDQTLCTRNAIPIPIHFLESKFIIKVPGGRVALYHPKIGVARAVLLRPTEHS